VLARLNLRGVSVATISIARGMRRTLVVCGVLTVVIVYGIPALAQRFGPI
jgi:hypothetical protein